jgi:pilus assembly protein Flp/PilA
MIGRAARVAQRDAERGATMLEYALVATFIAVVVSAALVVFGPAVANLFTGATAAL